MKPGHPRRLVVSLTSGPMTLDLCPEIGGAVVAWRWTAPGGAAIDLMRPMRADALASGDVEGASCFPLAPFSNRLRDGSFSYRGRRLTLPRNTAGPHVEHGHAWQRPWMATATTKDTACLLYRHKSDQWPFDYGLEQRFELAPDSLTVTVTARNLSDEPMPFGFGLHPYFPKTPQTTVSAQVAGIWETDAEVMPIRLRTPPGAPADLGGGLALAGIDLDNCFTGWDGTAVLHWPERGLRLRMAATPPLRFLVVYAPRAEDFLCLEPVSNCTDAFNLAAQGRDDTGMIELAALGTVSAKVVFQLC